MDIKSLRDYYITDFAAVESIISTSLGSDIPLLDSINAGILKVSGKRLRPLLCLLLADSMGEINEVTHSLAAATELLHNATLLHDDVADESPSRRGCPTVNAMYGVGAGVLVGDFWLVKAMLTVLRVTDDKRIVTSFAGTLSSLAEGEMLQMQKADTLDTSLEDYKRIIYCKTASLFEAAATAAACSVNASDQRREAAEGFARLLGLAFQIKDDIFDYIPSAQIGKPVCADIEERKMTLPLLLALEKVDKADRAQVIAMVRRAAEDASSKAGIMDFVSRRRGTDLASEALDRYIAQAIGMVPLITSDPQAQERLKCFALFVGSREL